MFYILGGVISPSLSPHPPLFSHTFQAETLHYGDWVSGEIAENGSPQRWQFEGREGDIILIDALAPTNSELDPILQLLNPSGEMIVQDDDGGSNVNARIGTLRLPDTGTYTIVLSTYAGHGRFSLVLSSIEQMPPLTPNKPLQVELSEARPLSYVQMTNLEEGMYRLATLTDSPTAAPLITLYRTDGSLVSSSAYRQAGVIEPFITEANQQYIAALEIPFPGTDETHQYEVSLSESEITFLANSDSLKGTITPDRTSVHFFEAHIGQQAILHVTLLEGEVSPAVYVRSIDGASFLFSNSGLVVSDLTVTLDIPADTVYTIEITDGAYMGETGTYSLEFEIIDSE